MDLSYSDVGTPREHLGGRNPCAQHDEREVWAGFEVCEDFGSTQSGKVEIDQQEVEGGLALTRASRLRTDWLRL